MQSNISIVTGFGPYFLLVKQNVYPVFQASFVWLVHVSSAAEVSKVCEYLTGLPQKVKRPTTPNTFGGHAPGMKAWVGRFQGYEEVKVGLKNLSCMA